MSSQKEKEKDRRSSKLFGTRISSIFAHHGNSSSDHLHSQRFPSSNTNLSIPDDSSRSLRSKSSNNSLKPLSRGPFSNYLHNRSNTSIDSKGSSLFFDSKPDQAKQQQRIDGPADSNTTFNFSNSNAPQVASSQKIETTIDPSSSTALSPSNSPPTTPSRQGGSLLRGQDEISRSPQILHRVSLRKSPNQPKRKPPPPMLDPPNTNPRRELEKLPSLNRLSQPSLPSSNKAVHDDLNDIIGTLESEIGSMMANRDSLKTIDVQTPKRRSLNDDSKIEDDEQSTNSLNVVSNNKKPEPSPLPEPQTFLFSSPTKSIAYSSDLVDPVTITRSQGNPHLSDYTTEDESGLDSPSFPRPSYRYDNTDDPQSSDGGSFSAPFSAPYPLDSPVVPSPMSQNFNPDITFDDIHNSSNFHHQQQYDKFALGREGSLSSMPSSHGGSMNAPESPIGYKDAVDSSSSQLHLDHQFSGSAASTGSSDNHNSQPRSGSVTSGGPFASGDLSSQQSLSRPLANVKPSFDSVASSIYSPLATDSALALGSSTQSITASKKLSNKDTLSSSASSGTMPLQGSAIRPLTSNGSVNSRTGIPNATASSSASLARGGSVTPSDTTGSSNVTGVTSTGSTRVPLKTVETSSTADSFPRSVSTSSRPSSGHQHYNSHHSQSLSHHGSLHQQPTSGSQHQHHHRKSSSISSLFSSNSSRNVNLATLKKTLNLKPGEGERSNYVLTIRRNSGTAYNESGPGKWKLPTGIQPIDKTASAYSGSNGRYMRLGQAHSQGRSKKVSGVELKHGHLQPRLLAAEVSDFHDGGLGGRPKPPTATATSSTINTIRSNLMSSPGGSSSATLNNSGHNDFKSSNSSIIGGNTGTNSLSRGNSLARTATMGSIATGTDSQSIATGRESSTSNFSPKRTTSVSTSSSGSLSDNNIEIGGYYQHPGYRYAEDDNDDNIDQYGQAVQGNGLDAGIATGVGNTSTSRSQGKHDESLDANHNNEVVDEDDYVEYDDKPRLVLANPDYSSDSE